MPSCNERTAWGDMENIVIDVKPAICSMMTRRVFDDDSFPINGINGNSTKKNLIPTVISSSDLTTTTKTSDNGSIHNSLKSSTPEIRDDSAPDQEESLTDYNLRNIQKFFRNASDEGASTMEVGGKRISGISDISPLGVEESLIDTPPETNPAKINLYFKVWNVCTILAMLWNVLAMDWERLVEDQSWQ